MKIFDCFSYWDEDLLLELRLNVLEKYMVITIEPGLYKDGY